MVFYQNNIVSSFRQKKMHQFLLISLLTFSINTCAQASESSIIGNKTSSFLSFYNQDVIITTENADTEFSGIIQFLSNEGGVRIIPTENFKIIIKPLIRDENSATEFESDGTTIGSRKNGSENRDKYLKIYPIPTNQYINILSDVEICKYEIYEMNGFLKYQKTFNCIKNSQINVSFLPKGNYILVLETKNTHRITKYFIKN